MDRQSGHKAQQALGTLVAVVGPSGAGKDTLMNLSAQHFADRQDVHFVQRVITRPHDSGGEDHRCVTCEEFDEMRQAGAFAIDWNAHGLSYGIPASVREKLALGHLVVANGSRSVLDRFAGTFSPFVAVNVVARPDILASRLEARGRESREDILRRLARGSLEITGAFDVVTIDNSGSLEDAAAHMNQTLSRFLND